MSELEQKSEKETALRQIRGIGKVTARRLVEGGIDSYGKIVAAGAEGLGAVAGMNLQAVPSILTQAAELAGTEEEGQEERNARLREEAVEIRRGMVTFAEGARQRFGDKLDGKKGRKLEKEIFRLIDLLGRVEKGEDLRPKRTGRALAKARRRLEKIDGAGVKKSRKKLKRARRALERGLP